MGKDKTTETQTQTQRYEPTAEERELNQLELNRARATAPQLTQVQNEALNLSKLLLQGQALPGYLAPLSQGIGESMTQDISRKAVSDILPSFQSSGILDSGIALDLASRTAGDVRRNVAEFNIGNLQNLLNLALSGQAQVQAPVISSSATLGSRLAGLRAIDTIGTGTTKSMNPFLKSFQTSLGGGLGSGMAGGIFGSLPGGGGFSQGAMSSFVPK